MSHLRKDMQSSYPTRRLLVIKGWCVSVCVLTSVNVSATEYYVCVSACAYRLQAWTQTHTLFNDHKLKQVAMSLGHV